MRKTYDMQFDLSGDEPAAPLDPRVGVITQLQHLLATADAAKRLDSATYLRRISAAATRLAGPPRANIEVLHGLAEGLELDAPRMTALGLLAGEALVNALRHAHPAGVAGEIRLESRRFGNDVLVTIEDDGVGLPEDFDASQDGGVGYRAMRELARHLKARLSHRSTPLGLRVDILFAL